MGQVPDEYHLVHLGVEALDPGSRVIVGSKTLGWLDGGIQQSAPYLGRLAGPCFPRVNHLCRSHIELLAGTACHTGDVSDALVGERPLRVLVLGLGLSMLNEIQLHHHRRNVDAPMLGVEGWFATLRTRPSSTSAFLSDSASSVSDCAEKREVIGTSFATRRDLRPCSPQPEPLSTGHDRQQRTDDPMTTELTVIGYSIIALVGGVSVAPLVEGTRRRLAGIHFEHVLRRNGDHYRAP